MPDSHLQDSSTTPRFPLVAPPAFSKDTLSTAPQHLSRAERKQPAVSPTGTPSYELAEEKLLTSDYSSAVGGSKNDTNLSKKTVSDQYESTASNELIAFDINAPVLEIISPKTTGPDQKISETKTLQPISIPPRAHIISDSESIHSPGINKTEFSESRLANQEERHTIIIDEEDEEFTNNGLSIHYLPNEVKMGKFSFYRQSLISQVWEPQFTEIKKESSNDKDSVHRTNSNPLESNEDHSGKRKIIRINANSRTTLTPTLSTLLLKFLLASPSASSSSLNKNSETDYRQSPTEAPTIPDSRDYPGMLYKDFKFDSPTNQAEWPADFSRPITHGDMTRIHNQSPSRSSSTSTANSVKPRTRSTASSSLIFDMESVKSQFLSIMPEQSPETDDHSAIGEENPRSISVSANGLSGNSAHHGIFEPLPRSSTMRSLSQSNSHILPSLSKVPSLVNTATSKRGTAASSPMPMRKSSSTSSSSISGSVSISDLTLLAGSSSSSSSPSNLHPEIPERLQHNLSFYRSSPSVSGSPIPTKEPVTPNISIPMIVPPLGLYCHIPNILGSSPPAIHGHCSTIHKSDIYIFGGKKSSEYRNDLYIFCCISKTLRLQTTSGDIPPPMISMTSVVMGNYIIYFGGSCGDNYSNDVYVLDLQHYRFIKLDLKQANLSLPAPRRGHSMIIYNDPRKKFKQSIIIFGGMNGKTVFNDTWKLDINLNDFNESKFTEIPQKDNSFMSFSANTKTTSSKTQRTPRNQFWPSRRCYHTATMVQSSYTDTHQCSKMLIYGGSDGSASIHSDIWLFDPFDEKWSFFPTYKCDKITKATTPFNLARVLHTTTYDGVGKWLMVSGGFDGSHLVTDVWKLSLRTGAWAECPYYGILDRGKCHHTSEYYDGRCYFIGGANLSLSSFTEIRLMNWPFSRVLERLKL